MALDFNTWSEILKQKAKKGVPPALAFGSDVGVPELLAGAGLAPQQEIPPDDGFTMPGPLPHAANIPGLPDKQAVDESEYVRSLQNKLSELMRDSFNKKQNEWSGSLLGDDEFRLARQRAEDLVSPQRASLKRFGAESENLINQPSKLDLSPLMALADSWTGSKLAQSYRAPMNDDDRTKLMLALKEKVARGEGEISDNERDFIKSSIIPRVQTGLIDIGALKEKSKVNTDEQKGTAKTIDTQRTPDFVNKKPPSDEKANKRVSEYANKLEQAKLIPLVSALAAIRKERPDLLDPSKTDEALPGYENEVSLTSIPDKIQDSSLGKMLLSQDETAAAQRLENKRQIQPLINRVRNALFGGALTPTEADEYAKELGDSIGQKGGAVRRTVQRLNADIEGRVRNLAAGYEDVVPLYESRYGNRSTLPTPKNPFIDATTIKGGGKKKAHPTQAEIDKMTEQQLKEYMAQ